MNRPALFAAALLLATALPACGIVETPSDPPEQVTYYVASRQAAVAIEYAVGDAVRRDTLPAVIAANDTLGTSSWSRVFEAGEVPQAGLRATNLVPLGSRSFVSVSLIRNGDVAEFDSSRTVASVGSLAAGTAPQN